MEMKVKEFVKELGFTRINMVDTDNKVFSYENWPYSEVWDWDIKSKDLSIFINRNECTINVLEFPIENEMPGIGGIIYKSGILTWLADIQLRMSRQSAIIANLESQIRRHQCLRRDLEAEKRMAQVEMGRKKHLYDTDIPAAFYVQCSRDRQHAYESSLDINKNISNGDSTAPMESLRPSQSRLYSKPTDVGMENGASEDNCSNISTLETKIDNIADFLIEFANTLSEINTNMTSIDLATNAVKKMRKKTISALVPIGENVNTIITDMDAIHADIREQLTKLMDETIRVNRYIDASEKRLSNVTTWASESSIINANEYKGINRKLDLILSALGNTATCSNDEKPTTEKDSQDPVTKTKSSKRK